MHPPLKGSIMIEQTTRRVVEVPTQRWENEGGPTIHKEASDESTMLERVRARAFAIFSSRMQVGEHGDAASDWTRAEQEVAAQPSATKPAAIPHTAQTSAVGARETTTRTTR